MIHFQAPILVKIREGIRVNMAMTASHAIEKNLPQKRLKPDIAEGVRSGTYNKPLRDADYEEYGAADTISFWFIGGTSLSYRVGHEITQEDFDRISRDLQTLEFRTNDRKSSDQQAGQAAK